MVDGRHNLEGKKRNLLTSGKHVATFSESSFSSCFCGKHDLIASQKSHPVGHEVTKPFPLIHAEIVEWLLLEVEKSLLWLAVTAH
ncbi:hypothetical protein COU78_03830 [Candidatus Peregrinibacteria bacterium CG10_big_fil_rev_8_21_14_0_10_49_24]|nr:MAG: hypothetical protein COU78_03830 [Candidatus Peregrinibacteria bacterium CG10_big_fil_rev_8_21_14_0_10_49_24]